MKLTRKKILCIIAAISLICVTIICAYSISSANKAKKASEFEEKTSPQTEKETKAPTETETLDIGDYLAGEETSTEEETTTEAPPTTIVRELAFECRIRNAKVHAT